jgi:transcriptional regulator with XRE-family HTH domain
MTADARVAHQVGAALRRIRDARGLRLSKLAGLAGISRPMLSRYEHGHASPVLPTLVKLLKALDCTAEEFGRYVGPWGCVRPPLGGNGVAGDAGHLGS